MNRKLILIPLIMLMLASCGDNISTGDSASLGSTQVDSPSTDISRSLEDNSSINDEVTYVNEYFTAKNCSIWNMAQIYEVDEALIFRYTADEVDLFGLKLFNLNKGIIINQGYNITWYEKNISNSNIIVNQRDYLEYGDNIYFIAITNLSSQVMAVYAINMYVEYDNNFTSTEYCYFDFTKNDEGTGYSVKLKSVPSDKSFIKIPRIYKRLPVLKIEKEGFANFEKITGIFIPNSVIIIDSNAFIGGNISRVLYFEWESAPSGYNHGLLQSYWGVNEEDIIIRDGIQYLITGEKAIVTGYTLDLLSRVTILNYINRDEKKYEITIIAYKAFIECEILVSITIPNSIISIGEDSFYGCHHLKNVYFEIDSKLESIGAGAFADCFELSSINLPSSVVIISHSAFSSCESLTSIVIPASVIEIGFVAFGGCDSLTIYCEISSKPSGWNTDWNYSNRPVYWYGQWHYENETPKPFN